MNEDKLYNEILRESSEDSKYIPPKESSNKDIWILIGCAMLLVVGGWLLN